MWPGEGIGRITHVPEATAGHDRSLVLSWCWDTEPVQDISPTLWGQILSGPIDGGCTS